MTVRDRQWGNQETKGEATAIVRVRDEGGLDQGGRPASGEG